MLSSSGERKVEEDEGCEGKENWRGPARRSEGMKGEEGKGRAGATEENKRSLTRRIRAD